MKITALLFSTLVIMILLSTCYYDSQEYLFPKINNQCDTTGTIHFSSVDSVLQNGCVSCHNLSTASGGVNLDGYSNVYTYSTTLRNNTPILVGAIRRMSGFYAMPLLPAAPLDECSIRKIEIWIEQGAQNN
jgi:hypothetical protein